MNKNFKEFVDYKDHKIEIVFDAFNLDEITKEQQETYDDFINKSDDYLLEAEKKFFEVYNHHESLFPCSVYIKKERTEKSKGKIFAVIFNRKPNEEASHCVLFKDSSFWKIADDTFIL